MKRKIITAFLLLIFCVFHITAEDIGGKRKITTFGYKEDVDSSRLYDILHHNAPEDFRQPGVPAVAVVGKGGKFVVGLGGYIKAVAGFDFGHPIPSADEFITSQIPMHPMDGDGTRFNLSAKQTHIFLNFVALPGTGNEIGAFVSANFLNDYLPTVQYAYLKYRGLKAGYDNTLFSDPACGVPAVDYEGPCSNTASPVAGISYSYEPHPHGRWLTALGFELPRASFTTVANKTRLVYQRIPDIPVAGKFSWNEDNSWIRFSAIFRNLTYREIREKKNHNKFGYGLQLSGAIKFLDKLTFYYQGAWGRGIASMLQDADGEGLDLTPSKNGNSLITPMIWGGFGSLQYEISRRLSCSVTYSQMRAYVPFYEINASESDEGTMEWNDMYKYTQYVSANIFFQATNFFNIGIEHIWGRRVNQNGIKCGDNRIQMAFQLAF